MSKLIKKTEMDCPICNKVHYVEERKGKETAIFKGVEVEYEDWFYRCANEKEENEFYNGGMWTQNLEAVRAAYMKKTLSDIK